MVNGCGSATLNYSGITLVNRDQFGERAVKEPLWATQRLFRDHSGERAVEELLWATPGSLW